MPDQDELSLRSRAFWDRRVRAAAPQESLAPGMLAPNERLAEHRHRAEINQLHRLVDLPESARVLDLGCGTGRWSFYFARYGYEVVGVDFSEQMIEACNSQRSASSDQSVLFLQRPCWDIEDLGRFDLIFAGGLLQCITDEQMARVVRQCAAVCQDSAMVITRDTVSAIPHGSKGAYPVTYRRRSDYDAAFAAHGFERIAEDRAATLPQIIPWLMRVVPLPESVLDSAIALDGWLMRSSMARLLLPLYHRLTGRGTGHVLDHRFAVYRKRPH